jgi:acyl carrier protein
MNDSLSDIVRRAVAQHLDIHLTEIRTTHRFERDLGLRPFDIVLIALRLEEVENVEVPIDRLDNVHKVADLTALLRTAIANDNHIADELAEARRRRRARGERGPLPGYPRAG